MKKFITYEKSIIEMNQVLKFLIDLKCFILSKFKSDFDLNKLHIKGSMFKSKPFFLQFSTPIKYPKSKKVKNHSSKFYRLEHAH